MSGAMEEDERREAAIASTPSLQPNFNPSSISKEQLSKFQELHRRRLQMKSKSQKKFGDATGCHKGNAAYNEGSSPNCHKAESLLLKDGDSHEKSASTRDCSHKNSIPIARDSFVSTSEGNVMNAGSHLQQNSAAHLAPKKRQKLHWGLDTRERWERKANM